jgi:hypothetical protein
MRAEEAKKICPDICLVHVELIGEKQDNDRSAASTGQSQVDGRSAASTGNGYVEDNGGDGRSAASLRHADKVTLQRYREASAEIFEVRMER